MSKLSVTKIEVLFLFQVQRSMLWEPTKIKGNLGLESTTAKSDFEAGVYLEVWKFQVSGLKV